MTDRTGRVRRMVIARPVFVEVLARLMEGAGGAVDVPAGTSTVGSQVELICGRVDSEPAETRQPRVRFVTRLAFVDPIGVREECVAVVQIGRGENEGRIRGDLMLEGRSVGPVALIDVTGPGMRRIVTKKGPVLGAKTVTVASESRWSRTIGALGAATWQRLVDMGYGLVGLGRSGSLVARHLLRIGAHRLTLVDPDVVEEHNLGEADDSLSDSAVGLAKAIALGRALVQRYPEALIRSATTSVASRRGVDVIKQCDVLICTVDHDSARLALNAVGVLYQRPVLDIATGVELDGAMGATVRLALPGDGCLFCVGGLDTGAARAIASSVGEQVFRETRDGLSERAGSLLSLNQLAASLGMRMLEDLVGSRIDSSRCVTVEFGHDGRLRTHDHHGRNPGCPFCRDLAGGGDEAMAEAARQIHRRSVSSP